MKNHNTHIGHTGENLACTYLQDNGCIILDRHYRNRFGEIDIIAQDTDTLCFVEVKTRTSARTGDPSDAVTRIKQQHLIHAAESYLQECANKTPAEIRFDVISIILTAPTPHIQWIKNAFEVGS